MADRPRSSPRFRQLDFPAQPIYHYGTQHIAPQSKLQSRRSLDLGPSDRVPDGQQAVDLAVDRFWDAGEARFVDLILIVQECHGATLVCRQFRQIVAQERRSPFIRRVRSMEASRG
jgi:hypothetical protein